MSRFPLPVFCLLSLFTVASARAEAPPSRPQRPPTTEAARVRLAENLKTVDANLVDVKENLATTKANLKTIHDELGELETLEKEHNQLKKKYDSYLISARAELAKSQQIIAQLDERERALTLKAGDESAKAERQAVQVEKQQRMKGITEAQNKIDRTEKLMIDLLKNLRDIQARREPLTNQLQSWGSREKEYERLTQELLSKKAELEKVVTK